MLPTHDDFSRLDDWLPAMRSPGGKHHLRRDGDRLVDDVGVYYSVTAGIARLVGDGPLAGDDAKWNRIYEVIAPLYELNERLGARVFTGLDMRAEQRLIVQSLDIVKGSSLLEVCTGPGVFQPWLAEAVGSTGRLVALDLSSSMVRRCAKRTRAQRPAPLVIQGNGAALPFANESFDYIFHFGGIKLFTSPQDALVECARVLRPGGRLFLGDEGYEPTIPPRGWRRRVLMRMNPGFQRPPPPVPSQLKVVARENVYDGLGFLWTLARIESEND
jgi:ubiquinone/menaquinone biosynthesis C-methylase UbiE